MKETQQPIDHGAGLSKRMLEVLTNCGLGEPARGVTGRSAHGGLEGALAALRRRGLIDDESAPTRRGWGVLKPAVPHSVIFLQNGLAAVFNRGGEQIAHLQGTHAEAVEALKDTGFEWERLTNVLGEPGDITEFPNVGSSEHTNNDNGLDNPAET